MRVRPGECIARLGGPRHTKSSPWIRSRMFRLGWKNRQGDVRTRVNPSSSHITLCTQAFHAPAASRVPYKVRLSIPYPPPASSGILIMTRRLAIPLRCAFLTSRKSRYRPDDPAAMLIKVRSASKGGVAANYDAVGAKNFVSQATSLARTSSVPFWVRTHLQETGLSPGSRLSIRVQVGRLCI